MLLRRARREVDVATDVEPAEQTRLLENDAAFAAHVEPTGIRFFETRKATQDRRFAAPAWPKQCHQLAATDVQTEFRENRVVAEGLGETADFDCFHDAVLSVSVQRSERCSIARIPLSVILPHSAKSSIATRI